MLFHQMSKFLQLLDEKLIKMPKHASLPKKVLFLAKSMIFHAFSRNLRLLAKNLMKTPKSSFFLERLLVLPKSMIFHAFLRNEQLFKTLSRTIDENGETC